MIAPTAAVGNATLTLTQRIEIRYCQTKPVETGCRGRLQPASAGFAWQRRDESRRPARACRAICQIIYNAHDHLRAFIAIDLPPDVKAPWATWRRRWGRVPRDAVRWVRPEMHLTLRFLATHWPTGCRLFVALDGLTAGAPLALHLTEMAASLHAPAARRLLGWRGGGGAGGARGRAERGLDALGLPPEDKLPAHLTLGRQGRTGGAGGTGLLCPACVPVAAVHLIESQLRPEGCCTPCGIADP
jgi:2'-5' RNA ligase